MVGSERMAPTGDSGDAGRTAAWQGFRLNLAGVCRCRPLLASAAGRAVAVTAAGPRSGERTASQTSRDSPAWSYRPAVPGRASPMVQTPAGSWAASGVAAAGPGNGGRSPHLCRVHGFHCP